MPESTKLIKISPFKYTTTVPFGYMCSMCGKTGVRLWREYNTYFELQSLYCKKCAKRNQRRTLNAAWYKKLCVDMKTDKIGNLVPAVPTEDGKTFWGYTSVPEDGCVWWNSLPK